MWKKTTIAAIATIALAISAYARPHPNHNSNSAEAAIGGLITGLVLADAFDDGNVNIHLARNHRNYRDGWQRYDSDYRDYHHGKRQGYRSNRDYRYDNNNRYNHSKHYDRSGHYEYQKRKVWIPGHWEYIRGHHGHTRKVWTPGHYEGRRVKVWVSNRSGGRCR